MSLWTNIRDRAVSAIVLYGISKAVDPKNTGWVQTRDALINATAEDVVGELSKKLPQQK